MIDVRFTAPVIPQGKGRARATIRGGKIATYTPEKTASFEASIAWSAQSVMPHGERLDEPLRVDILAVFPKPKRLAKTYGFAPHMARPDGDNVRKAVLDALAPWLDDKCVVSGNTVKVYGKVPLESVRVRSEEDDLTALAVELGLMETA